MHIEVLVEDKSGSKLLENIMPEIIANIESQHTWRIVPYKGIGRLPSGLKASGDPAKRALLNQLPRLIAGYGKTPGFDLVVVVLDCDNRDYYEFSNELNNLVANCHPAPNALFGIAIEEMEAWFLGDRNAILAAYPKAKKDILNRYIQDSICGTWEVLADAIYPGGSQAIKKAGWPPPGIIKNEWAEKISPHMDASINQSPSFCQFRDALRQNVR